MRVDPCSLRGHPSNRSIPTSRSTSDPSSRRCRSSPRCPSTSRNCPSGPSNLLASRSSSLLLHRLLAASQLVARVHWPTG
eukprot:9500332-Pyramimonas_sp.AAC.1